MKKTFFSKALLLVAVALVGVAIATSCEKEKNGNSDGQGTNPPYNQIDTTYVSQQLDPYMDSIYRSIPDPDTTMQASIENFSIYGRWCWKSRYDTICSMILDFKKNGIINLQCFKSDEFLHPVRLARFSNCYFGGFDSCSFVVRNDSLIIPLWYITENGTVVIDTIVDMATLSVHNLPAVSLGVHKIALYNNQKVMRLTWTGDYMICPDAEETFYLTKQERINK